MRTTRVSDIIGNCSAAAIARLTGIAQQAEARFVEFAQQRAAERRIGDRSGRGVA